jgi:hypothetical protein
MPKTLKDKDEYREKRQAAYEECCVEAYGLVVGALRHLGVVGDNNHDVIQTNIEPKNVNAERKKAIKQLKRAGALLYNAPFVRVSDRFGPQRLWSVEDQEAA